MPLGLARGGAVAYGQLGATCPSEPVKTYASETKPPPDSMSHRLVVPYVPVTVLPVAWQRIVTVAPSATLDQASNPVTGRGPYGQRGAPTW